MQRLTRAIHNKDHIGHYAGGCVWRAAGSSAQVSWVVMPGSVRNVLGREVVLIAAYRRVINPARRDVVVDRETFDLIKRKHGAYASWAVWAEPTRTPKSNVGVLSVLDPDLNATLLQIIRPDVVMLGLNLSRFTPESPLGNFHDGTARAQDYKIRYAFAGTPYYGAYMTDFIKEVVELKSGTLMRKIRSNQSLVDKNVRRLLEELDDLGCVSPTVIAFGRDAYELALEHLPSSRSSRLVGVRHYSDYIGQEKYGEQVLAKLSGRPDMLGPG